MDFCTLFIYFLKCLNFLNCFSFPPPDRPCPGPPLRLRRTAQNFALFFPSPAAISFLRAWCRYTRGRFECTHGERGGEGRRGGVSVTHQHQHQHTPKPTHCTPTTHNAQHTTQNTQGVIGSSAYQKFAHVRLSLDPRGSPKKPLDLTHSQFENRSRTTCSRFLQPFALLDKVVQLQFS